jgi:hypothetical protein
VTSAVVLLSLIVSEANAFDYKGFAWGQDTVPFLINVTEPSHRCSLYGKVFVLILLLQG